MSIERKLQDKENTIFRTSARAEKLVGDAVQHAGDMIRLRDQRRDRAIAQVHRDQEEITDYAELDTAEAMHDPIGDLCSCSGKIPATCGDPVLEVKSHDDASHDIVFDAGHGMGCFR